jgi:hypothetical protein
MQVQLSSHKTSEVELSVVVVGSSVAAAQCIADRSFLKRESVGILRLQLNQESRKSTGEGNVATVSQDMDIAIVSCC